MSLDFATSHDVLDLSTAMSNMDGDVELLQEIVAIFMETSADQIETLREAIRTGDVQTVAIDAHGMKGGASNFCAGAFVEAALALELLAKGGSLDGAEELLETMEQHLEELREVISVVNWEELARSWQG